MGHRGPHHGPHHGPFVGHGRGAKKYTYGEFRISRPTSINVSNPAFEIKRCVLYFVLSDFAPPPNKIKTNGLYLVLCRGGGYQENDFLIVSDGFAHGFSPPLCAPGGGFIFVLSIFAPPRK